MPLSTSWAPADTPFYPPEDRRFWQILKMSQGFLLHFNRHHQGLQRGNSVPSQTHITGSTTWLWYLLSTSPSQQSVTFIYHCLFGTTTDIDLRNLIQLKEERSEQYMKEYLALHDLASFEYNQRPDPLEKKADYAQIKFEPTQYAPKRLDWTITTTAKAPLHNYDIQSYINPAQYKTVKFNLPSFVGANAARENKQFLLNPAIFQIENGMSTVNYAEFEENFTPTKDVNVGKTVACVLKTICKISLAGVTLADHTMQYLNALAKTPFKANAPMFAFTNIQNPNMLQATLNAFYHSYYKFSAPEDKYIFESVLASMTIEMPDGEKSLYQVLKETIKAEAFRYLDDEKFSRIVSAPKELVNPNLQYMVSLLQPIKIVSAADPIVTAQDIIVQTAPEKLVPSISVEQALVSDLNTKAQIKSEAPTPVAAALPDIKPQTETSSDLNIKEEASTAEKKTAKKKKAKNPADVKAEASTSTPIQQPTRPQETISFLPPLPITTATSSTKAPTISFAAMAAKKPTQPSPLQQPAATIAKPQQTQQQAAANSSTIAKPTPPPKQQNNAVSGLN
jgi:hypothetical protein